MARPTLGCGLARVHVYDRDGVTSRGVLTPTDLTWTHSKSVDGSACSFTADGLAPAMVSSPAMLEDALVIIELDVGGVWTAVGTPYVLAPGTGSTTGAGLEGLPGRVEHQPSGVGAAVGLCGEWLVLHSGGIVNRRGPLERYIGWQSASFVATSWPAVDVVTPASLIITDAKYGQPNPWPAVAATAAWVYRDPSHGDTGSLSLFRFGSFTVATARKYLIGFSCDEESRVYLDGPGYGGVIIESTDQETGYTIKNIWGGVLQPGTYYVSAEMTTVASAGGDGFDACRMYVATAGTNGRADTVALMSGSGTKVWRQSKTAVRPGFTPAAVLEILRAENETWGIPSADLLTVVATDTMPTGEERVWSVGTSVAQVIADLELDVRCDVDTTWHLNVTASPGTDLSATLGIIPGADPAATTMNAEGHGWSSDPVTGTRAVVLTPDGFIEVIGTTAETTTDARGMFLESSASGSIAKGRAYAVDAIAQSGRVRRNYHADVAGITGAVPFVTYKVCDTLAGLTYTRTQEAQQVLSITGTNQTSRASFSLEMGAP